MRNQTTSHAIEGKENSNSEECWRGLHGIWTIFVVPCVSQALSLSSFFCEKHLFPDTSFHHDRKTERFSWESLSKGCMIQSDQSEVIMYTHLL
ncbi:hypothetical protein NPIL_697271 [Nephila pilipes]|uniref:Uncharacterized protein n=1 Tax=Nephila pilipes TaxID=299642 RepID=A0A8X6QWG7_NEPPI|nr:hypothetical protein NPIL_697271 [Nephila pilipes]